MSQPLSVIRGETELSSLMREIAQTVTIAPHVLTRIVAEVGTAPSAIIAATSRFSTAQLEGVRPLPQELSGFSGLSVDPDVESSVRDLPRAARSVAELAALAVLDRSDALLRAAGLSAEEWVHSPVARLLSFHVGRFAFRDPRARSALRKGMSSAETLIAHRILAETYESLGSADAALWHRTMASTTLDPELIPALDQLAHRLLRAGDAAHAYEVSVVAADHGSDDGSAAATAAKAAFHAGYLHSAHSWHSRKKPGDQPIPRLSNPERPNNPWRPQDVQSLIQDLTPPLTPWTWPHDNQPRPTPLERADAVIAHCFSLFAAGNLAEALRILVRAAYHVPLAIASSGAGAALARRLDLVVNAEISPTTRALGATSPHRNSPRFRLSGLVDDAIRATLSGNTERARVLFAVERQRGQGLTRFPIAGFNDLEAWMLSESPSESSPPPWMAGDATREDPRTAWARIVLAPDPSPDDVRSAESRLSQITSPYERAHVELCAAATFDHLGNRPATRSHLIAASAQFAESGALAFRDLAERLLYDRPASRAVETRSDGVAGRIDSGGPHHIAKAETLTKRESQVAELLATGASNQDIASTLNLSVRTVEVHLSRIYRKLGIRSRVEYLLLSRKDSAPQRLV